MLVSTSWLQHLLNVRTLDPVQLSAELTQTGLEVESCEAYDRAFPARVVAGKIEAVAEHEEEPSLTVCTVRVGATRKVQLVTAAKTMKAGQCVAVALPGTELPSIGMIRKRRFGDIVSNGMLCSEMELGLGEIEDEVLLLDADTTPGTPIRQHFHFDEAVLDVSVLPNRGDCASMLGIARECAAVLRTKPVSSPKIKLRHYDSAVALHVFVKPQSAHAHYSARVIHGLNPDARTPDWMRERIIKAGMRCIFPVVDITNYVMLELGQPLHAFDLNAVQSAQGSVTIGMAQAQEGEKLKLLDGSEITAQGFEWWIKNGERPIALAGIKGGQHSGIHHRSCDIVLEAAWFDPAQITRTVQFHGLSTEASYRYERGVDPNLTEVAMKRACELLVSLCGGRCAPPQTAQGAPLARRKTISMSMSKLRRYAGCTITRRTCESILQALQMKLTPTPSGFSVKPPSWRFDIDAEHDVIEEVLRLYGLDRLPVRTHTYGAKIGDEPHGALEDKIDHFLVGRGYKQVIHYSFADRDLQQQLCAHEPALALHNPLSSEFNQLRTSLIPGLIGCVRVNLTPSSQSVRVFERGRVYGPAGAGDVEEREHLAWLCYGKDQPDGWAQQPRELDFFDLKADVEGVLTQLNRDAKAAIKPATHTLLHPGYNAQIIRDGRAVGWLGKIHPRHSLALRLPEALWLAWMELESGQEEPICRYQAVSKFPGTERDLSFVMKAHQTAQELLDTIVKKGPEILKKVEIFDHYHGQGLAEGTKALAVRLYLGRMDRTLKEDEIGRVLNQVVHACESELGVTLRGKMVAEKPLN